MSRTLYDIAREVTDEVLGPGAYAEANRGNGDPGVRAAIARSVDTMSPMDGQVRVLSLWAYLAVDTDGTEGVVSFTDPGTGKNFPLVGADLSMVKMLRPIAEMAAQQSGVSVTLAHFSQRTDQEVIGGS